MGEAPALAAPCLSVRRRQALFGRLVRDTSKLTDAKRAEHGLKLGEDWDETIFNVFHKDSDGIRHVWASEMAYAPEDPGQHHRAGDLVDPLWAFLDMTPEGRGDFFPSLTY